MIHLDAHVRIVPAPTSWIEGEAERQLRATAALPDVRWAVGMPDLHPGRGHPIGVAVRTERVVYPHLVGGDIGCGMALFRTDIPARRANAEKLAKRLRHLEGEWDGDAEGWLAEHGVHEALFLESLGTIGGGNHFAELQAIDEVLDASAINALGLEAGSLVLLVHSGSRGLGESILRAHVAHHGAGGLDVDDDEGRLYLRLHDTAVRWGHANRALIAHRVALALGASVDSVLDVCHNGVTPHDGGWLHRKGAAPHDEGPVVIPGSRGALTYLVEPQGDGAACGHSLAHGAGRKWTRGDARSRMRERFRVEDLVRTPLGGWVVCEDKDLLFEEAPDAYKRIDQVVGDLVRAGVCRTVTTLRPVVTYKTRRG